MAKDWLSYCPISNRAHNTIAFFEIEVAIVLVYQHESHSEAELIDAKTTAFGDRQGVDEWDFKAAGISRDGVLAAKVKKPHL